jgi:hypothetical protein
MGVFEGSGAGTFGDLGAREVAFKDCGATGLTISVSLSQPEIKLAIKNNDITFFILFVLSLE